MSSYTCHIDKNFQHTAVLRQCLLNHIPIFQDKDCISIRRSDSSGGSTSGEMARITISLMKKTKLY